MYPGTNLHSIEATDSAERLFLAPSSLIPTTTNKSFIGRRWGESEESFGRCRKGEEHPTVVVTFYFAREKKSRAKRL